MTWTQYVMIMMKSVVITSSENFLNQAQGAYLRCRGHAVVCTHAQENEEVWPGAIQKLPPKNHRDKKIPSSHPFERVGIHKLQPRVRTTVSQRQKEKSPCSHYMNFLVLHRSIGPSPCSFRSNCMRWVPFLEEEKRGSKFECIEVHHAPWACLLPLGESFNILII